MTRWTAIVPIKRPGDRKTRLGSVLDEQGRVGLTDYMLSRVLSALQQSPSVSDILVLGYAAPEGWSGQVRADEGRGLNAELQAAADDVTSGLVVLHADLPGLSVNAIECLIASAGNGVAIAPDRWRRGTNALAASRASALAFAFGEDSFARHQHLMPGGAVLEHEGLALDVDLPGDLEEAVRSGRLPRTWT